jgi:hypothetical protein
MGTIGAWLVILGCLSGAHVADMVGETAAYRRRLSLARERRLIRSALKVVSGSAGK